MAGDELDELYGATPDEFTALRTRLVSAAKKRKDTDAAKRIAAARKPTTAAWVVNNLVHTNTDVKPSLTDLGKRLREAHAAMDGPAIRELSAEQRSLVDQLARAALDGAEVSNPTAALREDVVATLQAAVADPDVAQRLGRLAKAEQWSGFGDFGATAVVTTSARSSGKVAPKPNKAGGAAERTPSADERASARKAEEVKAALAAAERAKDDADGELSDRQTDLAVARLRRDEMRQRLDEAERALAAADDAYRVAKQASRDAADLVKAAKERRRTSRRAK